MLPDGLSAVASRSAAFQQTGWSLDTIAATLAVRVEWLPMPDRLVGMVVVDHDGAVASISDQLRGSPMGTMMLARLLADVIAAQGHSLPSAHIVDVNLWRHDARQRPMWAAATLLAVSAGDVDAIDAGALTVGEVAELRNVPPFIVRARMRQEIAYGWREGDQVGALCDLLNTGPVFLRAFDRLRQVAT